MAGSGSTIRTPDEIRQGRTTRQNMGLSPWNKSGDILGIPGPTCPGCIPGFRGLRINQGGGFHKSKNIPILIDRNRQAHEIILIFLLTHNPPFVLQFN